MSYDALLIHRVEVYRRTGQVDRFRQPVEFGGNGSASAVYRGRIDVPSGGERFTERSRDVVIYSHKLFLEPGVELYESDRVTVRTSETGAVLCDYGEVKSVEAVYDSHGLHHYEAKLDCRKSGDPLHDPET